MRRVILVLLVFTGLAVLAVAGFIALFGLARMASRGRVPSRVILEANLETGFVEYVPDDTTATLMFEGSPRIRDFVTALDLASRDDRVHGLVAHVGGGSSGLAISQEIRDAVQAFRDSGKFAVAYAETFGELSPANVGYYTATAFDEIWLQPSGDVNLTGLIAESPFIRNALGKLGVTPRMDHRHEYKNAMNMFTDTSMGEDQRVATAALLRSQFDQLVSGIAAGRDLEEMMVRAIFDGGPLTAAEALEAGVVDRIGYWDEARDEILGEASGGDLLSWRRYLHRTGKRYGSGTGVALIYGAGNVHRGASGYSPMFGDVSMGSDTVASAFHDAINDDSVKAILFRVDSPGGSAVASDVIWRETVRAREAGKPVIVSMGNVAASGGYWVSMDASRIIAQPGTITASIGVVAGKFLTTGFWENMGINWDDVQTSSFSSFFSSSHDYTPEGWAAFEAGLDRIYDDFTTKVAAGRDLPLEHVREIARGRVWTGEDALTHGLVDELGGYAAALAAVRQELGLATGASLRLKPFPREKTTWEKLSSSFFDENEVGSGGALARIIRDLQPAARAARQIAGPAFEDGVVYLPVVPAIR